jgi:hypothetical protein
MSQPPSAAVAARKVHPGRQVHRALIRATTKKMRTR